MNNKQLAAVLDGIALGNGFSEVALQEAYNHPVVTSNDKQCIQRYLYGKQQDVDHVRLQEIAQYIRESS